MATRSVNNSVNGNALDALSTAKTAEASKAGSATAPDVATAKGAPNTTNAAGLNISNEAKARADAFNKAYEIAKNTPDVREDRVAELKRKIQDGTYQIDSGKIADGMLREAIADHLAEAEER